MEEKHGWFDRRKNVVLLLRGFFAFLVVLLLIDFIVPKHGDFYWEDAPGFFASFGFISGVALISIARIVRRFIRRDEDYYDG